MDVWISIERNDENDAAERKRFRWFACLVSSMGISLNGD